MYTNVSQEFIEVVNRPSRHFAARFTRGDSSAVDITVYNIVSTSGTCGSDSVSVGCAFASYIEVSATYSAALLEGEELFLELGLLLDDGTYEWIPFGYWTVQKPSKENDRMTFQAVDRIASKMSGNYVSELTYPATVAAVLSELSTKTGMNIICNLQTSVTIAEPIENTTYRGALATIAGLLLANAWCDRNGEVRITPLHGSTVVEINYDYVKTQPVMDETETTIDGVKVYVVEDSTDQYIETGTAHKLEVSCSLMTQDILNTVASNIVGLEYGGGVVTFMGNPLLDPSDCLVFRGGRDMQKYMLVTHTDDYVGTDAGSVIEVEDSRTYVIPCMEIIQQFDGGLLTTVTAPGSFEATESTIYTGAITASIERQQRRTTAAQETADEALSAAEDAAMVAESKNKTFFQSSQPTAGMAEGDMWFDSDHGNVLYEYTSSGWVVKLFGRDAIAARTITALEIAANTITANEIAANTITANEIAANTITANEIAANTITANEIAANAITASELAADSVTAEKIDVASLSAVSANMGEITAGVMKSSDYAYTSGTYADDGMIIDLDNQIVRMTNTALINGTLYATNVNLSGKIVAITGEVGGFEIDSTSIHTKNVLVTDNSTNSVALSSVNFTRTIDGTERNGLRFAIADKFGVTNDGIAYISNIVAKGTIYATLGEIGGFAIDATSIHTKNVAITSNADSSVGFSSANFTRTIGDLSVENLRLALADGFGVTKGGVLYAKEANFANKVVMYNQSFATQSGYQKLSLQYLYEDAVLPPVRSGEPTPSGATDFCLKVSGAVHASSISSTGVIRAAGQISTRGTILAGGAITSYSNISADGNIEAQGSISTTGTVISVGSVGTVANPDTTYRRVRIFNASGEGSFRVSATGAMGIYSETQSEWLIYTKPEAVGKWAYIPMTLDVTSSIISHGIVRSSDSSGATVKGFSCQNTQGYYSMNVDASGNFVIYDQANSKAIMKFYPSTAKLWDTGYLEIPRILMVAGPDPDDSTLRMVTPCVYTNGRRINYLATAGNSSTAAHQTWLNVNGQFNGLSTYDTQSYASASSDIRLKANVTDTQVSDAMELVRKIKIRAFDWKDMAHEGKILDHQKIGFIADELEELDGRLAAGGGYNENGGMNIKTVDTFYLLGYIVKALQEIDARMNTMRKGA